MSDLPLIEARGVSKTFRIPTMRRQTLREQLLGLLHPRPHDTLRVLTDVSLEVRRGETLGVMGRNGSGKSTLLKILCGIYQADTGMVAVRAPVMPILELALGWNPDLDAVDNILVLSTIMGMTLKEARAAVEEILAFAGLEQFANQKVRHFSSGMSARLAYSVAFKAVREVLVLDEIFAVGDAGFKARCEERYRELIRQGYTVVLVSHDPGTVASFCSRAVLIEGGRILVEGTGADVADAYMGVATGATQVGVPA